ncbi:MAG TPA: rRNA maturation RNase YbeY [Saprospiraceae bacterium]|nr:rRNA maturation RNase YbeY [Saprospiraceae bacterium]
MLEPILPFKAENTLDFYSEDIDFELENTADVDAWLKSIIKAENKDLDFISYIFCSDLYLLEINRNYLQKLDLTDTISFPYNDNPVEGDVFMSIERIKENAEEYKVSFTDELHRVLVHSTLHLLGYSDKDFDSKKAMTQKENHYLSQRSF